MDGPAGSAAAAEQAAPGTASHAPRATAPQPAAASATDRSSAPTDKEAAPVTPPPATGNAAAAPAVSGAAAPLMLEPASAASQPPPAASEATGSEPAATNGQSGGQVDPPGEQAIPALPANADALLKEFYTEVKAVDRDNEVNRIISAFRLNPFEQLGLRYDATEEEIRRQFRKLSLLVHPDKCSHPKAKGAFEMVNTAAKQLQNEDFREELLHTLGLAKDEVRKEYRKTKKHDPAIALAAVLHEGGKEGVLAEYENTDDFHTAWKAKSQDMMAKFEWRRRKLTARLKDEEHRIETGEAETRQNMKAAREHHKNWESSRDKRVNTWRDFAGVKPGKKQKTKAVGGIKPPKLKQEDEDRTFVQRSAVQQFRPVGQYSAPKPVRE